MIPQPIVIAHGCHAIGCKTKTPRRWLMCPRHWGMVSPDVQAEVNAAYEPSQTKSGRRPSKGWLVAATKARLEVAEVAGPKEAIRYLEAVLALHEKRAEAARKGE